MTLPKTKVLIIGIDGATWDNLDDYVLDNFMPTLKGLRSRGSSGILKSTFPAVTPAAWTTCTSGCDPQTHGLTDFQKYSFPDNLLEITNSTSVVVPSMWHYLGQQGYRVASLNVPFTYPAYSINGIMVSGLGCPGTGCDFTYPKDFKKTLLKSIPDYGIALGPEGINKRNNSFGGTQQEFTKTINRLGRRFENRLEVARLVQKENPVDIMMVQFQQLDLLQHLCWPYIYYKTRDQHPWHRDQVFDLLKKLDGIIAELLQLIDLDNSLLIVASDHGFGPMKYNANVNRFLTEWGYIKRADTFTRMIRRTRRNLMNLQKPQNRHMTVDLKQPINWKKTRAIALRRPIYGAVYLNVKGRQPGGCVNPGDEYNQLIDELKEKFLAVTNPQNGEKVFERVVTPKESWPHLDAPEEIFGDLMVAQKQGYRTNLTMKDSYPPIEPIPADSLSASWHHPNGIHIIAGNNIKKNHQTHAKISDLAPTIYSWLGMDIPAEVDGNCINDVFNQPTTAKKLDTRNFPESFTGAGSYEESEQEKQALAEQLKNLGYLE